MKGNIKYLFFYIFLISFTLLFLEQVSSLIIKIGESVNYKSTSFKTGYIILSILIITSYTFLIWKRYIHNKIFTLLLCYIFSVYFLLSFVFTQYVTFIMWHKNFAFADCINILMGLHIISISMVSIKNGLRKNKKQTAEISFKQTGKNTTFFVEDKTFKGKDIDNEAILQKLTEVVQNFKPEESFSIGLNAVWGYGKSSFLYKFKKNYEFKNKKEIVFWYRVWKNKGSNAIIENFFNELKNQLKPYSANISSDIDNYVNSILSLSNGELQKIFSAGKDFLSENETLENFYTGINENIKKIDKQIIILLDDLDRLENQEIMNTLKLIRTLSDFNNIIFIAGYDRKYITDTIDQSKANYLDKIFNVEINLLPFDTEIINDELFRYVDEIYSGDNHQYKDLLGFNETFKSLFKKIKLDITDIDFIAGLGKQKDKPFNCEYEHDLKYQDFLKTYRDVKRFINEFKFNSSFLESSYDVVPNEYILLKLLVYKFRDLDSLIFSKIDTIFNKGTVGNDSNGIVVYGRKNSGNVYVYDLEVQENINVLLTQKYNKDDVHIINAVLCRLFGSKSTKYYEKNQNSISKIYYTDVYLRNNILLGKISITKLQTKFENNQLYDFVVEVFENTNKNDIQLTNEIKQFIYNSSPLSRVNLINILKTINYILPNSNYKDNQNVLNLINYGYEKFYREYKPDLLNDLFEIINIDNISYLDKLFSDININLKRNKSQENYSGSIVEYDNNILAEEDLITLYTKKLKSLIKDNHSPEIIFNTYIQQIECIATGKIIILSKIGNYLLKKQIETRFEEYFNSKLFESIRDEIKKDRAEFENYEPSFYLAQIFSKKTTIRNIVKDPSNKELLDVFYKEGWDNFNAFISQLELSEVQKEKIENYKFENAKAFVQGYIDNNYKPLDEKRYNMLVETLPF